MNQSQQSNKEDIVVYKLSNELKCELCNKSFETKESIPFRTIKLCKDCIKEKKNDLYDYIFEITDENIIKIESCNIQGRQFTGEYLTWKQLKDYLNTVENDELLSCPVICQEHHHFRYITCNPVIEIRCDDEVKWHQENDKEFDGDFIREQFELILKPDMEDKEYLLLNQKQFNLSLTI